LRERIGVVVPTLGLRTKTLLECLYSIKNSGASFIVIVCPINLPTEFTELANKVVPDPGNGLAEAINFGISSLPSETRYATWIGDDDLYVKNGLDILAKVLDKKMGVSLVYGICTYINSDGQYLGENKIGQSATKILKYGPDLIPQPSSLFRVQDFNRVGGLNPEYKNAFDFDFFLKLKKVGALEYVPERISFFRWHDESLSVNQRWRAVTEASKVRKSHLKKGTNLFSFSWEYPVVLLTFLAGKLVNLRSRARKPIR
jgi:hypothetical protein